MQGDIKKLKQEKIESLIKSMSEARQKTLELTRIKDKSNLTHIIGEELKKFGGNVAGKVGKLRANKTNLLIKNILVKESKLDENLQKIGRIELEKLL